MMISDRLFGKRLHALALQKARLISESEINRQAFTEACRPLSGYCTLADKATFVGTQLYRFVQNHPIIVATAVAAAFKFRFRRLLEVGLIGYSLVQRGQRLCRIYQNAARNMSKLSKFF